MGNETTTVVTTEDEEPAAPVAEAAVVVETPAPPADTGATEAEVQRAERLGVLEWDHDLHKQHPHPTSDDIRAEARAVLWEEAESLAQYAADIAAEEAAAAEAAAGAASEETVVVSDVPESEKRKGRGLSRFL